MPIQNQNTAFEPNSCLSSPIVNAKMSTLPQEF